VTVHEMNPEAVVLNQLREQWEKVAAVLVWKLARDGVRITFEDLEQFGRECVAGEAVLFTHGHKDSIEFAIVTAERARALAEHDRNQSGSGGN
jgi:hypothetical protein